MSTENQIIQPVDTELDNNKLDESKPNDDDEAKFDETRLDETKLDETKQEVVHVPEFPFGLVARLTVSQDCLRLLISTFQFLREFDDLLRVSPFAFHSFVNELHLRRPHLDGFDEKGECLPLAILGEVHIGMLRFLLAHEAGDEDFLATVMLDRFTWPEILKQYLFFHNHLLDFNNEVDDEDGTTKPLKEVIEGFSFGLAGDYFILSVKARLFILSSLCDRLMLTTTFLRRIQWKTEGTLNETVCIRCGGEGDIMVACSMCPSSFHLRCCDPPLRRHVDMWTCPPCLERKKYPSWFIWEQVDTRPSTIFPPSSSSSSDPTQTTPPTTNLPPNESTEPSIIKCNTLRQELGTDCAGRSYSVCSGFIFVASPINAEGKVNVECIIGFPHLLCPLIAFLSNHCDQDRAIGQALLTRFEIFERLLELQFAPSTTKLKGLLIGIPLPRAEGVQELAQSIVLLSGTPMHEVTGKLVNVINVINLINNSAFAKKEGTQDSVVFAPDVHLNDFQPRVPQHMLLPMHLDQNYIGLFFYLNRYPASKSYAHKALPSSQEVVWSAVEAMANPVARTLAQIFETLSSVTNMRNRLIKIHEKLPRRVFKAWWCMGKFGHEWTMRARACTSFHEIRTLMLELESGILHDVITSPTWLSGTTEYRTDANQIIEVIVGGMGQTLEQALGEWKQTELLAQGPQLEGEVVERPPLRHLIVQQVWQKAVNSARTFSRLALLLRVLDSCLKLDLLQKPRTRNQPYVILEASPPLIMMDSGVFVYDVQALELAQQNQRGFASSLPNSDAAAHLESLRQRQNFVVLVQGTNDDSQDANGLILPPQPPAQHFLTEAQMPALWLFLEYENRLRSMTLTQRAERAQMEQNKLREQERLAMEAQRLSMYAHERMQQEARERAYIEGMRRRMQGQHQFANPQQQGMVPPRPGMAPAGPAMTPQPFMAPTGQVMAPTGSYMTPTGPVMTPNGPIMTPAGPIMGPTGPIMTPTGSVMVPTRQAPPPEPENDFMQPRKTKREVEGKVGEGDFQQAFAAVKEAKLKEPKLKEPKLKEPKVKEPKVKEPKVKEPKVKEPKVKEPKVKEPKIKEPKTKEPKAKKPKKEKAPKLSPTESIAPDDGLYCLCRTPYNDQLFYVGCDLCGGWFHGTCVGVSPAYAEKIKKYKCPKCRPEKKPKSPKVSNLKKGKTGKGETS